MNAHQRRLMRRLADRLSPDPAEVVNASFSAFSLLPDPRTAIENRAYDLLCEHLVPAQRDDLKCTYGFNLRAADGLLYRIVKLTPGHNNILSGAHRWRGRERGHHQTFRIGVWPTYHIPPFSRDAGWKLLPVYDIMLGQLLGMQDKVTWQWMQFNACCYTDHAFHPNIIHDYGGVI